MGHANITITVKPKYVPEQSEPLKEQYTFTYTIGVGNEGPEAAQLISRHWIITDADGGVDEVKGLGVVGHQPLLQPGQAFEYTSGCRLRTPTGRMSGQFFFVDEDGERYPVDVPAFELDATGQSVRTGSAS